MVGLSMAFIVAEVVPLILATCFTIIAAELKALDRLVWILITPYIATGAVAPLVGSLEDMLGRKWALVTSLIISAMAATIQGSAPYFAAFIVGQVLSGIATGIQLLTVTAAACELVPKSKRGSTIGYIVMGFLPFSPSPMYGLLIATHSWRWIFLLVGVWSVVGAVILATFYRPPPRTELRNTTAWEIMKRIDHVGFILCMGGFLIFLVGLNLGSSSYPWNSTRIICLLVVGLFSLILWIVWEIWLAPHPMFPARVVLSTRHFVAISVMALAGGINYIPLTVFWTIEVYTVYQADFALAGIYLLPLGFCLIGGAFLSALLMTFFRKGIQWVLLTFAIMQTVGMSETSYTGSEKVKAHSSQELERWPRSIGTIFPLRGRRWSSACSGSGEYYSQCNWYSRSSPLTIYSER